MPCRENPSQPFSLSVPPPPFFPVVLQHMQHETLPAAISTLSFPHEARYGEVHGCWQDVGNAGLEKLPLCKTTQQGNPDKIKPGWIGSRLGSDPRRNIRPTVHQGSSTVGAPVEDHNGFPLLMGSLSQTVGRPHCKAGADHLAIVQQAVSDPAMRPLGRREGKEHRADSHQNSIAFVDCSVGLLHRDCHEGNAAGPTDPMRRGAWAACKAAGASPPPDGTVPPKKTTFGLRTPPHSRQAAGSKLWYTWSSSTTSPSGRCLEPSASFSRIGASSCIFRARSRCCSSRLTDSNRRRRASRGRSVASMKLRERGCRTGL